MSVRDTLNRIFGNDVVMSRDSSGNVDTLDVNRMQAISSEYAQGKYKRMYQGGYSRSSMGMSGLGGGGYGHGGGDDRSMRRLQLFQDYESMSADPIIGSALDVYADEIATEDEYGKMMQVNCENGEIKSVIENLLFNTLDMNMNLRWWARGMLKYGDFFLKLHVVEDGGVVHATPLDTYMMAREQSGVGDGPTQFYHEDVGEAWEQWEVAHFRLLSDSNFYPYGRSILENGRQIWKQLCMAEGSRVWTPGGGHKEIQDIEDGDEVLSYDPDTGELVETEAHAAVKTGEKKTFRVRTSNREFEATATHPVLTRSGEYVPVKDLEAGDEIRMIGALDDDGNYPDLHPQYATRARVVDTEAAEKALRDNGRDKVACEVCGEKFKQVHVNHLKKHGITSANEYKSKFGVKTEHDRFLSGQTTVSVDVARRYAEDLNISEDAMERTLPMGGEAHDGLDDPQAFARFFGFMLGDGWIDGNTVAFALDKSDKYVDFLEREGFNPSIQYSGTVEAECRVHSVWLRRLMEDVGFITGTENKRVPQWAYTMPVEGRIALLEGFADADGCEFKDGHKVGGVNKTLLGDLKTLAEQSGYSVTNVTVTGETSAGNMAYELKFRENETRFTRRDSTGAYQKVRSIESAGKQDVYDIQVKNKHHNFVCEGAVVHNSLTEEAMLIHRIMRAPEKRVFKIDVGNMSPDAIDSYMHEIIQDVQQTPLVDQQTGEYNLEFNLQNMLEDFYFPVRGDSTGTEVESLQGLDYQAIEDVEYLRKKLMSALRIPNAFLGYEQEIQGKCCALSTRVPTLSGDTMTAGEIVEHYQENDNPDPIYTYSYDSKTGKMVAGEVETAEITRENAVVVDVELDNGEVVTTTPDHKFMTRDGEWVEAQNLSEGDSLMPLYRGETKGNMSGYTTVYHPGTGEYEAVHRVVAEQYGKDEDGKVIHHADFDKFNNRPDNLDCSMTPEEHFRFHSQHAKHKDIAARGGRKGGAANAEWLSEYASGREPANKNGELVECDNCGKETYKPQSRLDREQENYYCSCSCANQISASRDKVELTRDQILAEASDAVSFADLIERLGTTRKTLYSRIERFFGDREEFAKEHMPEMSANALAQANHEVASVTVRDERIDTCDIQVKKYKNFATEAGVIVHNSTLAQESLKFAENVRKLQKMMSVELEKIAAVHLIAKGYDVSDVTDFDIQLTDPSIIAEQERVDFLQKKIRVAGDAMDQNLMSSDYILKNLFSMSEEEIIKMRKQIVDDWKREFREEEITREGNDPVKTGRAYGTPSQLNQKGSTQLEPIAITGGSPDDDEGESRDFGLQDLSNQLRTTKGDVAPQYYQGGSPRAVNASEEGSGTVIQESFELGGDAEPVNEGSYMSLSRVEEVSDAEAADALLEELEQ